MDAKLLCALCLSVMPLLGGQEPRRDPLEVTLQDYWTAGQQARWSDAAALRDRARRILEELPAQHPQFAAWARSVAELYSGGGMTAQARSILDRALARTGQLPQTRPLRANLLFALSESWEQERNLLKAVTYRERALAESDRLPPGSTGLAAGPNPPFYRYSGPGPFDADLYEYQRLAYLYQQLGRKEDVDRVYGKMRSRVAGDPLRLASLYEQQGDLDQAAALLQKQVERSAADPAAAATALQSLAALRQREQNYTEAATALTRAVAMLESAANPELRSRAFQTRQTLAYVLQLGGRTGEADQIYEQAIAESDQLPDGMQSQPFISYANHLAMTKRGAKAEELLTTYMSTHPPQQPWEEANLLSALSNTARMAGDEARAQTFRNAAQEMQRATQPDQPLQVLVQPDLQAAQSAANSGNAQEAFRRAVSALNAAPQAADREMIAGAIPPLASTLADKNPASAAELYQRLFSLLDNWSPDSVQPLLNSYPGYVHFLLQQHRFDEASAALRQHNDLILASHSAASGWLEDVHRLRIDAAYFQGTPEAAVPPASDLLVLEENLAGTTSEPYLRALETLAQSLESSGDDARALPYRRQAARIARLVLPETDPRRGFTLINTAFALARARQFDEAEQLTTEAVALSTAKMRPPQPSLFEPQREQIRQMKAAGAPPPPPAVRANSRWINAAPRPAARPLPDPAPGK